jgi:hypothetical protein
MKYTTPQVGEEIKVWRHSGMRLLVLERVAGLSKYDLQELNAKGCRR